MIQGSGRCHYHPERPGLGICVECREVVCRECSTQFEGINRCASCLAKRLSRSREIRERKEWSFGNVTLALLASSALFALVLGAVTLLVKGGD
jgi:hypothetical protein